MIALLQRPADLCANLAVLQKSRVLVLAIADLGQALHLTQLVVATQVRVVASRHLRQSSWRGLDRYLLEMTSHVAHEVVVTMIATVPAVLAKSTFCKLS